MTNPASDMPPPDLYRPSARVPQVVQVPPITFLMIDGAGDPNTAPAYQEAVSTLYSVAYTLKFALKRQSGIEYKVGPLEGLWWTAGEGRVPIRDLLPHRDTWRWTMMIAQPDAVTSATLDEAVEELRRRQKPVAAELLRLERFDEGLCAQILYRGPYAEELPAIERLHAFIEEQGYVPRGRHHEIYLGDPRRTKPERLRTILRQPVAPATPASAP